MCGTGEHVTDIEPSGRLIDAEAQRIRASVSDKLDRVTRSHRSAGGSDRRSQGCTGLGDGPGGLRLAKQRCGEGEDDEGRDDVGPHRGPPQGQYRVNFGMEAKTVPHLLT